MRGLRYLRARRVLDIIVTVTALPFLVPLAAAAMVVVTISDRHAPLIGLRRVGRDGRDLTVQKIRTMRPAAPGSGDAITSSSDDRVTAIGQILRRWRLDELPQLLHVLSGDMSLIGPRPEDPKFVDLNSPDWHTTLQARPAIAGLTQVIASGWEATELDVADASTKYAEVAVPAKVALDAWYVDNACLSLDWKVVRSLAAMFLRGATWTVVHDIAASAVPEAAPLLEVARAD